MKGALGLLGVFLSFLCDYTRASASSVDCGNDQSSCLDFCNLCYNSSYGLKMNCLSTLIDLCVYTFEQAMHSLNSTDWCAWHKVSSLYSNMSICTEQYSECLGIPWPNYLVEERFVRIHSDFFRDCPTEELLSDPSPAIIFALVITPICMIPAMVSLVVLKTKNGDGSS